MTDALKQRVFEANMALPAFGLVTFTWGNVSGIDRERGLIAIKPSGVEYETMQASDMVVLNLQGEVVEGHYKPSSDTATHLELYARFPQLGGIVHTHSTYATSWAQAGVAIPPLGTTHADYFAGAIPCTRPLSTHEVNGEYELETGKVIAASLTGTDPLHMPGILVAQHGPFCWGTTPEQAVHNAVVLEEVAKMAWITGSIRRNQTPMDDYLLQKHFSRKHGPDAYYGQK
ncbi:L-ribulose-5-phosphate 4-epimerase [Rahnella bonaserana]|jgi:L-ribulose-5-phosphate 4-epimerase